MAMVGPLVAVVVTLLLAFGIRFAHLRRALIIVLAAAVTISSSYFLLPLRSRERIDRFFKGGIGSFVASGNDGRAVALVNSLNESVNHPLGVGLGGFERHVGGLLEYPHNIVAETFLEGGWLAGLTLMLLICVSLFQGFLRIRMSFSDVDIAFFGLMLFTLFYSLVAGDLNGNRMLFAFIACSLSF